MKQFLLHTLFKLQLNESLFPKSTCILQANSFIKISLLIVFLFWHVILIKMLY